MAIWNILRPFGISILFQFVNLVAILYISHHFGILNKEKSGNPAGGRTGPG
jgi:hypothetical protein